MVNKSKVKESCKPQLSSSSKIIAPVPNHWSSGIFTYNDKCFDLNKNFTELINSGVEFVDYERPDADNFFHERVVCGNSTLEVSGGNGLDAPLIATSDVVFNCITADNKALDGNEFCGIVLGDAFSKYKKSLGKPYMYRRIYDTEEYTYLSLSNYRLCVKVECGIIVGITLANCQYRIPI